VVRAEEDAQQTPQTMVEEVGCPQEDARPPLQAVDDKVG
jgi:hypothetical protein